MSTTGALVRSYTYDATGSVLTSGATTHTYYNNGRMKTARLGAASNTTYVYNALGQRVKKSGGGATHTLFMYDETGHLVGEYNSTGALVQETVWLGDIPVATLRGTSVFYVHTDQLNTPRKVTSNAATPVLRWRWDPSPFGDGGGLNENPGGAGAFKYQLRFPGQYFDTESNLNYNYFRDYDPAIGRYVESDPIGLDGGRNTYAYALGDPIGSYDALGLKTCEGKWIKFGDQVPELPTPRGNIPAWTCTCYWMCIGCKDTGIIWDGNVYNLPSSKGVTYVDYSGNRPPNVGTGGIGAPRPPKPPAPNGPRGGRSGTMGGAYACMCAKPGAETGCNMCYRGSIIPDYMK